MPRDHAEVTKSHLILDFLSCLTYTKNCFDVKTKISFVRHCSV